MNTTPTPPLKILEGKRLLLASASPRRRQLLTELAIPFEIAPIIDVEESYPPSLEPIEIAPFLSRIKADAYCKTLKPNDIVITADTVVIHKNSVLGKPTNADDAKKMLQTLSGETHLVVTGVTISSLNNQVTFKATTEVEFAELASDEIDFYVNTYNPTDKAGAYGIQEWIGCIGVKQINGSFYNVMGLPLHLLYSKLKEVLKHS